MVPRGDMYLFGWTTPVRSCKIYRAKKSHLATSTSVSKITAVLIICHKRFIWLATSPEVQIQTMTSREARIDTCIVNHCSRHQPQLFETHDCRHKPV